jgi:hypothetical protein
MWHILIFMKNVGDVEQAWCSSKAMEIVFKLNYVITVNISADKTSARETQYCFSKHECQL